MIRVIERAERSGSSSPGFRDITASLNYAQIHIHNIRRSTLSQPLLFKVVTKNRNYQGLSVKIDRRIGSKNGQRQNEERNRQGGLV
jgi:hypothetical protein